MSYIVDVFDAKGVRMDQILVSSPARFDEADFLAGWRRMNRKFPAKILDSAVSARVAR